MAEAESLIKTGSGSMPESHLPKSLSTSGQTKINMIRNLDQWVSTMRQVDRSCYQMMAIEVWAIAKTMESLFPGFWNRFMSNRQEALKQFMEHKQNQRNYPDSSAGDRPITEAEE